MKALLDKMVNGYMLTKDEAKSVLMKITAGDFNNSQIISFLTIYIMRTPSVEEFLGFREALLDLSLQLDFSDINSIDIVGTGGDGKDTFNISTLSCFVVAGAGYKVTKHGNYASSSVSGSSNVLENLGYKFSNDESVLKKQVEEANITFLHAPLFHPALKNMAPLRKDLGLRTIFNLLGPVVNPVKPSNQLLGVYSKEIGDLYSGLLKSANMNYSIVHSKDGYDEISLTSDFDLFTNKGHEIVKPSDLGFKKIEQKDLYGGDTPEKAAKIFIDILEGKGTEAQNNAIIANSAYAISTISTKPILDCIDIAKESLNSGNALNSLKKIV